MLIRVFGLLGLMLASGYFVEGVSLFLVFFRRLPVHDLRTLLDRFATMSLDLFSALALFIAAVGLLFAQRWARKMWLITMSILTLLHFLLAVFHYLGDGVSTIFLLWSWLVILLTALSWWYFHKSSTKVAQPETGLVVQDTDVAPE